MTPAAWITFWTILIATSVTGFALLALVVTIRGLQDVRSMLRRMKLQDSDTASSHSRSHQLPLVAPLAWSRQRHQLG